MAYISLLTTILFFYYRSIKGYPNTDENDWMKMIGKSEYNTWDSFCLFALEKELGLNFIKYL